MTHGLPGEVTDKTALDIFIIKDILRMSTIVYEINIVDFDRFELSKKN